MFARGSNRIFLLSSGCYTTIAHVACSTVYNHAQLGGSRHWPVGVLRVHFSDISKFGCVDVDDGAMAAQHKKTILVEVSTCTRA